MGASYWARWSCNGQVSDLPNLVLSCILAEGYDLLSHEADKQVFDHGGVIRKIAWSLNGGRWSEAPVDLTVTYAFSQNRTVANFYWKLSVRPFPTTHSEQASFERWVRGQMDRIVAGIGEHVEVGTGEPDLDETMVPAAASPLDDSNYDGLASQQVIGEQTATAARPARALGSLQYASRYTGAPPRCDRCCKPAVVIPGTTGRYYCLTCRRHLPRRLAMHVS